MSNLIKKEALPVVFYNKLDINPALKPNQKKALEATKSATIGALEVAPVKKALITTIIAANTRLGHKIKADEDIKLITNDLYNILLDSYKSLTIAEVGLAINLGTLGEFNSKDEVKYISVSTLVSWIKSYIDFKRIAQANNKAYLEANNKAKEAAKNKEKEKAFKESLPDQIKEIYLKAKEIPLDNSGLNLYNIYFDYLYNLKVINFTPERYANIKAKASNVIRLRNLGKPGRYNKLSQAVTNTSIKIEAKKLAFIEYINDLVEMEEPLPPLK